MEAEGTAEEDARGQRAGKEQKEASRSKNRGRGRVDAEEEDAAEEEGNMNKIRSSAAEEAP